MERISSLIERLIAPLRSAVAEVVRDELRRQHRAIIDAAAAEVKDAEEEIARLKATVARERPALRDAAAELFEKEGRVYSLALELENERNKSQRLQEQVNHLSERVSRLSFDLERFEQEQETPAPARNSEPAKPARVDRKRFAAVAQTKKTTAEVRADDTKAARAVACPVCSATPGDACISDDGKHRIPAMHPERYALGRQRARELADGLSRACPECNAAVGTPCIVNGRKGLHNARKTPAPT